MSENIPEALLDSRNEELLDSTNEELPDSTNEYYTSTDVMSDQDSDMSPSDIFAMSFGTSSQLQDYTLYDEEDSNCSFPPLVNIPWEEYLIYFQNLQDELYQSRTDEICDSEDSDDMAEADEDSEWDSQEDQL